MASESKITIDHNVIKKWVTDRGGKPSTVKGTANGGVGMLRINFPGFGKEAALEEISWDDFFKKFDEKNLAFLYQEKTKDGKESRFFKFVSRKEK